MSFCSLSVVSLLSDLNVHSGDGTDSHEENDLSSSVIRGCNHHKMLESNDLTQRLLNHTQQKESESYNNETNYSDSHYSKTENSICQTVNEDVKQLNVVNDESVSRTNSNLNCDEEGTHNNELIEQSTTVVIKNGNFSWSNSSSEPLLKNITIHAKRGELIVIIGQVGTSFGGIIFLYLSSFINQHNRHSLFLFSTHQILIMLLL
jgi:ATPase subunit of ABC transporter with duplicated ATPase domains